MAERGKFTADPARVGAAQDSMDALAELVLDMFRQFYSDLSGAQEILKYDEFGMSAGRHLEQLRSQLNEAGTALAKVLGAVPAAFRAQQTFLEKTQQGMVESIHRSDSDQSQVLPATGGMPGKY
jgi:hypothetical protein